METINFVNDPQAKVARPQDPDTLKESIKAQCTKIELALNEGKTPQEIADMFNGKICCHDTTQKLIDGYEEYLIDFDMNGCKFGITLWRDDEVNPDWHWENEDEIWLFKTEEFAHWKTL